MSGKWKHLSRIIVSLRLVWTERPVRGVVERTAATEPFVLESSCIGVPVFVPLFLDSASEGFRESCPCNEVSSIDTIQYKFNA